MAVPPYQSFLPICQADAGLEGTNFVKSQTGQEDTWVETHESELIWTLVTPSGAGGVQGVCGECGNGWITNPGTSELEVTRGWVQIVVITGADETTEIGAPSRTENAPEGT